MGRTLRLADRSATAGPRVANAGLRVRMRGPDRTCHHPITECPPIPNARCQASADSRRCPLNGVAAISSPARKPISAVTTGPNSILPQIANQPRSVFYAAQFSRAGGGNTHGLFAWRATVELAQPSSSRFSNRQHEELNGKPNGGHLFGATGTACDRIARGVR